MHQKLKIQNTLGGQLEEFSPQHPPFVGMYLCGPTVYGDPHLGHGRGPIVFDVVRRYLIHIGYKVRFVRNITDVGHLVNDADEGEDKIQKKARLEMLEPMEVAQHYTDAYNDNIQKLNVLRPSVEPKASGHIIEQIEMIEKIIAAGLAYEVNGSVYFDVLKYAKTNDYGALSGRVLEDLLAGAGEERRALEGQDEKRSANDFALWKAADPSHLMQWSSPWGKGFPGWHIECSAMAAKYLGESFDIHAGGMDLLFPHHEAEIAQSTACFNHQPVKYWLHNNMITINGQKMAKSLNNGIMMHEFYSGNHPLLAKAYTPMTLRFFVLMAHYRSTLDFSNDALLAAEKGYTRLMEAIVNADRLLAGAEDTFSVDDLSNKLYGAMNEDFNTPIAISHLFEAVKQINLMLDNKAALTATSLDKFKSLINTFVFDILGLLNENSHADSNTTEGLLRLIIELRDNAKSNKDYATSDIIRDQLKAVGIQLKDGKEGTTYSFTS
jgi:cysteinyl-tRNA synthetase